MKEKCLFGIAMGIIMSRKESVTELLFLLLRKLAQI